MMLTTAQAMEFQSTLSVRRATMSNCNAFRRRCISIHALREESDVMLKPPVRAFVDFNPRSP